MSERRIKPYDGWILPEGKPDPKFLALIESEFDSETDQDEIVIKRRLEEEKTARKMAILRTTSFPTEWVIGLTLFGWAFAKNRWDIQKVLLSFLFKKISYRTLLKRLGEYG